MNIYKSGIAIAGIGCAMLFSGCSDKVDLKDERLSQSQIFGSLEDAIPGRILVKFRSEVSSLLDKRSSSGSLSTGIGNADEVLDNISVNEIRRIFPLNKRSEERTRDNSLHLWYVIGFDEKSDLATVAASLASLAEVEKVEYSRSVKKDVSPTDATASLVNTFGRIRSTRSAAVNDPMYDLQWSFSNDGTMFAQNCIAGADINVEEAWKRCAGDPSIIVAVVDQGVMYDHPDLMANMWVNESETYGSDVDADGNGYCGDRHGFNFLGYSGDLTYGTGHGTHIAGTIAAVNNNNEGVAGIAGGTGNGDGVRIMSCQISDERSYASIEREAEAIKYAADNGAVILQCSWGVPSGIKDDQTWVSTFPLEKEVLDYFIHNAGSASGVIDGGIVIFAAGNESKSQVGYPSKYKDYISVTAVALDFTPAVYTNYGPEADLTAPGGDNIYYGKDERAMILSTMPPIKESNYQLYGYKQGTSMACPHVSGVAALGLSHAAKLRKHFKAAEFMSMLKESSTSIEPYLTGNKVVNYTNQNGDIVPVSTKLNAYQKNMGALTNANMLLDAVENGGVAMRIPNYTIEKGKSISDDLSSYLQGASSKTFTAIVADGSLASVRVEGSVITITAVKEGVTSVLITAEGIRQNISVIVRSGSGGSGWL